jgi:polar amino acid transport system substrate-binding protein
MSRSSFLRRGSAALALAAAAALALSACAGADAASSSPTTTPLGIELTSPAVNTAGVISCSGDFGAAPNQYQDDNGENAGVNVDVMAQIGAELGSTVEWQDIPFGSQIAALQAGRIDAMCTSTIIKPERLEVMYMVPYIQWGRGFLSRTKDPHTVDCPSTDMSDPSCYGQLSGLTVLTGAGSVEQKDLQAWNDALVAAGKPGITIQAFDNQSQAAAALVRGEGDISYHEDPQLAYFKDQFGDDVDIVFSNYAVSPVALNVVRSDDRKPLADAIQKALEAMKADGTYDALIKKWNLTAVDSFDVQ